MPTLVESKLDQRVVSLKSSTKLSTETNQFHIQAGDFRFEDRATLVVRRRLARRRNEETRTEDLRTREKPMKHDENMMKTMKTRGEMARKEHDSLNIYHLYILYSIQFIIFTYIHLNYISLIDYIITSDYAL